MQPNNDNQIVFLSQTAKVAEEEEESKKKITHEQSISNEPSPVIESNSTLDTSTVNETDSKLVKSTTLSEESAEKSANIEEPVQVIEAFGIDSKQISNTGEELKENLLEKSITSETVPVEKLTANEETAESNNIIKSADTEETELVQIVAEILANISEDDKTEIMVESNSNQTVVEIKGN